MSSPGDPAYRVVSSPFILIRVAKRALSTQWVCNKYSSIGHHPHPFSDSFFISTLPPPPDSSTQEVLSELRTLSQKFNKDNHRAKKQKVSSVDTAVQAKREEATPTPEEEEPLLLQRPERIQTLEELDDLGKRGDLLQQEPPRPTAQGQRARSSDAPTGKKKKEQMIDLQNLLTTKSPSVKSLAVPTIQELVSRDRVLDPEVLRKGSFCHKGKSMQLVFPRDICQQL